MLSKTDELMDGSEITAGGSLDGPETAMLDTPRHSPGKNNIPPLPRATHPLGIHPSNLRDAEALHEKADAKYPRTHEVFVTGTAKVELRACPRYQSSDLPTEVHGSDKPR